MKKRHELEYPGPCEEISPPGAEFPPPGAELSAPVEFPRSADSGAGERKRPKKRLFFMAAAFLTVAAIALPALASEPAPTPIPEPTPTPVASLPPEPTPTPVPPSPTPSEELPEPETYPLGDGTLEILVYSGVPDPENDWNEGLLYQGSFPEDEFTELALPEPEPQEGFVFLGYALSGTGRHRMPGESLTVEDAELIAPREDGVRRVVLNGAWSAEMSEEPWMPLTLDANGGSPTVDYDATGPLYSAGTVYTCAYPVPERPGYRFAGWYMDPECTGEPVETIPAHDFFEADGEQVHWDRQIPITLYARWNTE